VNVSLEFIGLDFLIEGVRCQQDTAVSTQKTDARRKKGDGFLPSVIGCTDTRHLTPETINMVLFKDSTELKYTIRLL
jgi:hypothetical protein